jgi:hypothetical protein
MGGRLASYRDETGKADSIRREGLSTLTRFVNRAHTTGFGKTLGDLLQGPSGSAPERTAPDRLAMRGRRYDLDSPRQAQFRSTRPQLPRGGRSRRPGTV